MLNFSLKGVFEFKFIYDWEKFTQYEKTFKKLCYNGEIFL